MKKRADFLNRWSLLIDFVLCVIGYFLIEAMARHSFAAAVTFIDQRTKVFFYNALLIFLTTLPAYLIHKRSFYRVLAAVIWLGLGAVNGIVLANRVTPLTGPDFFMIDEAIAVSGKYFGIAEIVGAVILVILLILALVRYLIISPRYSGKMHRKLAVFLISGSIAGFMGLTSYLQETKQLSSYFSNIAFAYLDYGFPYSLTVTVFDTGISQPHRYSEKLVNSVLKSEGEITESVPEEERPNIIVVQLESFFDVSRMGGLVFSEDPLPNWHELTMGYSSGYYTVPTVGAGTVNTEFETLTGMSLRFFGAGEYPYKGILKTETGESAAYVLSGLGYTTHALHNNVADFYGRRQVYSNLGFDSFVSSEYMDTQDDVNENGWMRDKELIPYIMDAMESTENRDFVFAVSVQAHGAYSTEPVLGNPVIQVKGAGSEEENCQWEYYVNQIHEVDAFVKALTEELSTYDEPTIVLFYGDHLPTLGITERDLKKGTTYDTDYLIWENWDTTHQDKKLTSYQAMAELFDRIGIHEGTMFNYHQTMKKSKDYLYDMQILQYDLLYGKKYVFGCVDPYSPTVVALGADPIRINSINQIGADAYTVKGENFTQSCVLKVNGADAETTYVDCETLVVHGTVFHINDHICAAVMNGTTPGDVLSSSNTIVYGVGELTDDHATHENALAAMETVITVPDPDESLTDPDAE